MAKKKPAVPLVHNKHSTDTRPNIPTRETAPFAADDPPPRFVLERDRTLDPQLVWKGKEDQDANGLDVPAVPLHVQEKVHPQAIIEDLRRRAAAGKQGDGQPDLFADFNGLDDFAKKLEFYQHEQHWTNRLILGDSLLVMASLAERESLRGQVQCIYFDPPYGIKFGSNWQVSTRKRDVKDAKAEDVTRQPEQIKAFRDTWELGIHSYLTYLRDRLAAARELLTESGSVFAQIGDDNVHLVRCMLDEVFGSENFVSIITFKKTTGAGSFAGGTNVLASTNDYLVWYCKNIDHVKYRQIYLNKSIGGVGGEGYSWLEMSDGTRRRAETGELMKPPAGARIFTADNLTSQTTRTGQTTVFPVTVGGKVYTPGKGGWKTNRTGMTVVQSTGRLIGLGNTLRYVRYFGDFPVFSLTNFWDDTTTAGFGDPKSYVVQTNSLVVQRCLLMTTDPGDLVLDPTCGSGTTAYVAEQWGRRWITIDTSRVALALARTRLMAARYPYYLLADSPEGRRKQAELTGTPPAAGAPPCRRDLHQGFVYRTVPHVTLKSIANNPDIKEGMTRAEIDAAIARHADTETLFDQPYEDKGVVRLCGPFTVESLSPHRTLPAAAEPVGGVDHAHDRYHGEKFLPMILDNLRKAGVKGTDKRQRIAFQRLDLFPGEHVHAEGETDAGAAVRVCVGPEFGTLGDAAIKRAALEAVRGSRCDLLLVCAFAFEPSVLEQTAELTKEIKLGKLSVLPVRMNPDLEMGDELLKKTGAGHLFTVFGEPDVSLTVVDGQVTVSVRGVDVFDPSTGEVRSGGTDDVACWFVDTDYDGQSFFVRQAYFLGADEPFEKLKKVLKAEVDEAAWAALHRATSQPFARPPSGRVAVKVINHFGDEVLKVYTVPGG